MFDVNAKIGHWPYRPLPGTVDYLLRAMDAHGIERAALSSLNAVFYFNPADGNREVMDALRGHRDRFALLAVMRPGRTGWEDDLARAIEQGGARGIVLYPNYHGYTLAGTALTPLVEAATAAGLPVCVQMGLEDPRRQFEREIVADVPCENLGPFAKAHPQARVVAFGLKNGQPQRVSLGDWPDNLWMDISNYEAVDILRETVEWLPPSKLLFGTNMPLFNPLANVLKLQYADIPEDARQAIAHANARALFS